MKARPLRHCDNRDIGQARRQFVAIVAIVAGGEQLETEIERAAI